MPRSTDTSHLRPWIDGDYLFEVYDSWASQPKLDTQGAVDGLVELASDGPVLELGIGTERLALPLLERGLEVHGIDVSNEMVAKLRSKPGGNRIPVAIANLAEVRVDARRLYPLILIVFNTLFGLRT